MTKRQRLKEIKDEIGFYGIRKTIAEAMLKFGEVGFEFSGHGFGMGGEDFGLILHPKKNLPNSSYYVNFCSKGRSCQVQITRDDEDCNEIKTLFKGTVGKSLKFLEEDLQYWV